MAADGSKAEGEFTAEHLLLGHNPRVQALVARLRRLVLESVPAAEERAYPVWRGMGYRHPQSGNFCGIFPLADRVMLLFEYGAFLPDPDGTLDGDGNQTRSVLIRRQRDIRVRPLKRLIRAALGFRRL